jgi:hypothetical protein
MKDPNIIKGFYSESLTEKEFHDFLVSFRKHFVCEVFTKGDAEIVYQDKPIQPYGLQDRYRDIIGGQEYICDIIFTPVKTEINRLAYKLFTVSESQQEGLKVLVDFLKQNPDKLCAYISFQDSLARVALTGDAKEQAYHVFGFVIRAITQAFTKRFHSLCMVYFTLDKNESQKRERVYTKIIQQEAPHNLEPIFKFENEKPGYDNIYLAVWWPKR